MRLKPITIFAIVLTLLSPTALFAANPKAGTKCSKAGQTQVYSGKKFTCIKSGKNLVWNKGVAVSNSSASPTPTPTPTPTVNRIDWSQTFSTDDGYKTPFNSWRDMEDSIPEQWRDLQRVYQMYSGISGIYHLGKYTLGKMRPNSTLTTNQVNAELCKISDPLNARNSKGFPNNYDAGRKAYVEARKLPGPKMNILVLPIFAEDTALPKNSPKEDYGKYLDFVTEWAEYSSGGPTSISVKFPDQYLKFNGKVSSYKIFHENNQDNAEHQRFNRDLISQFDSQIDFSGIDLVYIVAPAGTDLANLQQGVLGEMNTAEGKVKAGIVQYSYTLENLYSVKFSNFLVPYWWIHESYHGTYGLDDHYGNATGKVIGLGGWSLMSNWGGDMTAWEKWVIGFITDSQVNCLEKDSNATHWLAPSSVKTTEKKMTVIYVSKFKAVVIESIRAAGLYYKIPKSSQGVLVYELDLEKVETHEGLTVVLPTNRNPDKGPFPYGEATLRLGESVVSYGQRITVVESGTFGDVVKIEKA